jgi:SAM-dependent methyltransferase
MDPYQVFAHAYDQDVQLEVPRSLFRKLRPLVKARPKGATVLDLGCGSGLLTDLVAATGARVVGIDGSPAMLALARKRCARHGERVCLVRGRLERFELAEKAALALASGDIANHMTTGLDLRRYFASVARALAPGGLFVFDAITRYCFETYWPDNTHVLAGELGETVMSCDWEPARQRGVATITSYVRRASNRYSRHRTVLHEYFHAPAEIRRALRTAGFERVWRQGWSPWRWQDAEAQRHRDLWAARVAGPGRATSAAELTALGFGRG